MSAKQYKFFGQVQEINDRGETVDAGWSCMATWAQWSDYARLKAEVDALMTNPTSRLLRAKQAENAVLAIENDSLKAEVERLRKAGDELAGMVGYHVPYEDQIELEKAWNAAKDGKPSV
jgi:hypothetical protein